MLALSSYAPDAKADVTTVYNTTEANNNFASIISTTGYPEANIALDKEIADGSSVGSIINSTTLSVFNGPCSTPITVTIPFMDCTTQTMKTAPWVGTGDNLVQDNDGDRNENGTSASQGTGNCIDGLDNDGDTKKDNSDPDCINESTDNNGLPTYCDHYPDYLNSMFGNVRPRARYVGHQVVVSKAPATILQFVIFNPEALGGRPGVVGQMGDTYGFIDFVVLDNPIAPTSPSTITDFCSPLTSIPTLKGATDGSYTVTPGPEPYEVDRTGECIGTADNDGDTWVNDGCLVKSTAGPYYQRSQNPPPHTGLFGTGTHVVRTYSMSQRDVDGDGISNNLDSCPYAVNLRVDADNDGLDKACDPNDASASPGALAACTATSGIPDQDQDCFPNRQDNCPLMRNGDPYDPVPSGKNQKDLDVPMTSAPADLGPNSDGIGDACDNSPTTSDGHFHVASPISAVCMGDPQGGDDTDANGNSDNDGDGWCDSTEDLLGSNKNNVNSTPEHIALDLAIGTGTAAKAPGTCSDYGTYNHPDSPAVDNDGDTQANAADPGCGAIASDADQDGVPDSVDNCPNEDNEEQVNSDGDASGDECDTDDDNDGISDANEGCMGTDPKDNAADSTSDDANPFDFDQNTTVDVTDALTFLAKFPSAVTSPGAERYDYTCIGPDNAVDVTDALLFLAKFPSDVKRTITFTNNTGQAVNDIRIEFFTAMTKITGATAGWGPTGAVTPPSSTINLSTAGSLANGGTLSLTLVGNRPPVVRCYDWTSGGQVVNSSPKPCNFHNTTAGNVNDLYVEFGLDTNGDTVSDAPGISWCANVNTPLGKVVSLYFPQGTQSAHIALPGALAPSSVVRAQWWMPGPWTLQCWQWTLDGTPVGSRHGTCLMGP